MEPYLGEIRLFSFGRAPHGWLLCDGSLLNITNYQALFALLANRYGGDGKVTFGLPDLRGRVPVHYNAALPVATAAGSETVTLTVNQMPQHTHSYSVNNAPAPKSGNPNGQFLAATPSPYKAFAAPAANNMAAMSGRNLGNTGGSGGHQNMQPFLVLNFCIATQGIWPPQP